MKRRLVDIPIEYVKMKDIYPFTSNHYRMKTNKQTPLKTYLDEHGIKQRWLCDKTGITQAWVSKIVNGSEPRVRDALKISKALGIKAEELWPINEES